MKVRGKFVVAALIGDGRALLPSAVFPHIALRKPSAVFMFMQLRGSWTSRIAGTCWHDEVRVSHFSLI